jgi:hypothetical protein
MLFSHSYIPYIHIHRTCPEPFFQATQNQNQKKLKRRRSRSIRSELHHVRSSHTRGIKETSNLLPLSFMLERIR